MADRSQLFIYAVAGAIALFLAFRLIRAAMRDRPAVRRLTVANLRRWLASGGGALSRIAPALLTAAIAVVVLETADAWRDARVFRGYVAANPGAASLADDFRSFRRIFDRLPRELFRGASYLLPVSSAWLAAMWSLLALAKKRARFPVTRKTPSAELAWTVLATAGGVIFVWTVAAAFWRLPMPRLFGVVRDLLLALPFVLPPLLAALDDRTNDHLSGGQGRVSDAFGRLFVLQLLVELPGIVVAPILAAVLRPSSDVPGAWTLREDASLILLFLHRHLPIWQPALVLLLTLLAYTTALWAVSSASFLEALRRTAGWWKRDGAFFVVLCAAAGIAGPPPAAARAHESDGVLPHGGAANPRRRVALRSQARRLRGPVRQLAGGARGARRRPGRRLSPPGGSG